tara:strand:+ start:1286 stop:1786 length:501 start_codon:yes stop_codon:yes gene_type:complete
MYKTIILILSIFFLQKVLAEDLIGFTKIIDGDTININNKKIRLHGIDAPELKQKCKKDYLKLSFYIGLNFEKEYFCGRTAKVKLKEKINKAKIKCISSGKDKYKRFLATCYKGKINLNKWLVKNGYAVAYKKYSKRYVLDEDFAKKNKLGLWSGTFIHPEKWRKLN